MSRVQFFLKHWGLLNFNFGEVIDDTRRWGLHIIVFDRDNWYWGCFDEEYDRILTYWGLGPLGFVSRLNVGTP
jgi:hypothetical protein